MAVQQFRFVSGEMVCTVSSCSVLDAWLMVENAKGRFGSEFTREQNALIEAYDAQGVAIAKRTWQQWHELLLEDTYGPDWRKITEHAAKLL